MYDVYKDLGSSQWSLKVCFQDCRVTRWKFLALLEVKGFMVHHQVYYEAKLKFFLGFSDLFLSYRLRECSKFDLTLSQGVKTYRVYSYGLVTESFKV